MTLSEYVAGRIECAMDEEFGAPIEKICFAGIQLGGLTVLTGCLEWIARLLLKIGEQVMEFGVVVRVHQRFQRSARFLGMAGLGITTCQVVRISVVAGVESGATLEEGKGFTRFPIRDKYGRKLPVSRKGILVAHGITQRCLHRETGCTGNGGRLRGGSRFFVERSGRPGHRLRTTQNRV